MTKSDLILNLCSPKMRLADVSYNLNQILRLLDQVSSVSQRNQLCLFPQLALTGFSCGDLFFQSLLVEESTKAVEKLEVALRSSNLSMIIGLPLLHDENFYDAAAVIDGQGLQAFVLNSHPDLRHFSVHADQSIKTINWNIREVPVFYEELLSLPSMQLDNVQIVVGKLENSKILDEADIILNLNALPALVDDPYRLVFQQTSAKSRALLAICSSGANESTGESVFSGLSQIWQQSALLAEKNELTVENSVLQFDLSNLEKGTKSLRYECKRNPRLPFLLTSDPESQYKRAFEIQTIGLMRRIQHSQTDKLILGISGGADSSMALLVSCYALDLLGLDRKNLIAVSMPGPGSSNKTKQNTLDLTGLSGCDLRTIPISNALKGHLADIGHDSQTPDLTYENAQARERTQILMDLANMHNGLVVGTGDMSEIALGWSTYNGDQMSMYNVNAGLPKTVLIKVLVWAAKMLFGMEGKTVATEIIKVPFSPELKPLPNDGQMSQSTEIELGPYSLHDFFLWHAIQERRTPKEVFELAVQVFQDEFDAQIILKTLRTFYQRFFRHQFKRTASPDGPQIFSLSLSPRTGFRMPADARPDLWLAELDKIEKSSNFEVKADDS